MTSQHEIRQAVNNEFLQNVVGWDAKHVGHYLRYAKLINSMIIPEPFKEAIHAAFEGIEDSFKRDDREAAHVRESVLKDALLASQVAGWSPESAHRVCTPAAFERMLESLTQAALKHRLSEKVRLAAAACFAKKNEIASVEEMAVADLIGAMPIHAIREVQSLLVETLGTSKFDAFPEPRAGAPLPFPVPITHSMCNDFRKRHWGTQRAWGIVPEPDEHRGWMFEQRRVQLIRLGLDKPWTVKPDNQSGAGSVTTDVWPTPEAIIFHRTFELEQEMIAFELKLSSG